MPKQLELFHQTCQYNDFFLTNFFFVMHFISVLSVFGIFLYFFVLLMSNS